MARDSCGWTPRCAGPLLLNDLKKILTLRFLTPRMTLGQTASSGRSRSRGVVSTLPNIYGAE